MNRNDRPKTKKKIQLVRTAVQPLAATDLEQVAGGFRPTAECQQSGSHS
jgi:hypothetical protein